MFDTNPLRNFGLISFLSSHPLPARAALAFMLHSPFKIFLAAFGSVDSRLGVLSPAFLNPCVKISRRPMKNKHRIRAASTLNSKIWSVVVRAMRLPAQPRPERRRTRFGTPRRHRPVDLTAACSMGLPFSLFWEHSIYATTRTSARRMPRVITP